MRLDRIAVAPGGEGALVLPLRDDEVAVLALHRAEQLEAEEAGGPVDSVGPVGEALLQLLVGLRGDGDGVDLHDWHVLEASAGLMTSYESAAGATTSDDVPRNVIRIGCRGDHFG